MLHCQITSHKQSLIVYVYVATWPALSPRLATAQWFGGLCNFISVNIFYWGIHWGCKRSAVYVIFVPWVSRCMGFVPEGRHTTARGYKSHTP